MLRAKLPPEDIGDASWDPATTGELSGVWGWEAETGVGGLWVLGEGPGVLRALEIELDRGVGVTWGGKFAAGDDMDGERAGGVGRTRPEPPNGDVTARPVRVVGGASKTGCGRTRRPVSCESDTRGRR